MGKKLETKKSQGNTVDNYLDIMRGSVYTYILESDLARDIRRPSMENEIWKDVIGYKGIYAVSNLGRVKRLTAAQGTQAGAILQGAIGNHGYRVVRLLKNRVAGTYTIHRLVAAAFIGEPEVNHKDGNKDNNEVSNLEYVDREGNALHSYHILKNRNIDDCRFGKRTGGHSILTDEIVRHIRELDRQGQTSSEINQVYPMVKRAQIRKVIRRAAWVHIE